MAVIGQKLAFTCFIECDVLVLDHNFKFLKVRPLACLLSLISCLLVACDAAPPYPANRDERAHVFYEDHEFYRDHPEKGLLIGGGITAEPFSFELRPVSAVLTIPKNHLVSVSHQFQPWAKQIYDTASIVAMLPEFSPRTQENTEDLMKNASLNRLSITLGGLGNDRSAAQYRDAVQMGTLVLDRRRSVADVPVYRKASDYAGTEPFFALPDPAKFKSPLGNDIVIVCPPSRTQPVLSQYPVGDCAVEIALPPPYFPRSLSEDFGGVAGVHLRYHFNEKHLPQWPTLHSRVLVFVQKFVQ